jgi:hypothetical protein
MRGCAGVVQLAAHLTPADRPAFELIVDLRDEVREGFTEMRERFDRFESASPPVEGDSIDPEPFSQVVREEIRRLQRRRMLQLPELRNEGVVFGRKVDTVHRLASSTVCPANVRVALFVEVPAKLRHIR